MELITSMLAILVGMNGVKFLHRLIDRFCNQLFNLLYVAQYFAEVKIIFNLS